MSKGSTIRTMQDDLDEAINGNNNTKTGESKVKQNPVKLITENHSSDIQSVNHGKQEETASQKNSSAEEAPAIIDTSVVESDNNKVSDSQDDQLTRLIKKANSESNKDVEDKDQETVIKKVGVVSHQDEKIEDKKNMLLREVIDDQNNKEADAGENSIDDLKNLIGRISKPSTALKNNSVADNSESEKVPEKENRDTSEKSKPIVASDVKNIKNDIQDDKKIDHFNKKNTVKKDTEPTSNKEGQKDFLEKDLVNKKNKQSISENKTAHKEFLWSDLAKKINGKENENKVDNNKQEIETKKKKNDETNSLKSGVLNVKNDRQETKENKSNKKQSLSAYDENYISPNERLIHGKQEFYSSVSKAIKHKSDNDDMKSLKESERIKNEQSNIITKDEEYKKLKKGIIQKYNIKLSTLPWKKIILFGASFVALVGISAYLIFSKKQEPPVVEPPVVITGFEIERFSGLEEVTREKNSLVGLYNPNNDDEIEFNESVEAINFRIVDNNNLLILEDALAVILKKDKSVFNDGFFEATTGNYNIFIFETEKGTMRYGLAIETNENGSIYNVMKNWEADKTNNNKMISVFKNLFIDDASGDYLYKVFTSVDLNGIEINYAHLEDKDTALNYFIHNNILVITTSIDNNSTMIGLVTGS
ncbi:MAG: hypothetical protein KAI57_03315 [Candidatus Pacebacteria bacterium]|nr:hypothetical protein [Candidatus Paceibacterota bacterium]